MPRKREIDLRNNGCAGVVVTVRLAKDIIEMLDLHTDNRSEYIREATYEKLEKDMDGA